MIDKIFINVLYQDIKLRCIQKLYLTYIDQLVLGDKYFPMDYNNYFDIISEKVLKHSELLYQVYQRKVRTGIFNLFVMFYKKCNKE